MQAARGWGKKNRGSGKDQVRVAESLSFPGGSAVSRSGGLGKSTSVESHSTILSKKGESNSST